MAMMEENNKTTKCDGIWNAKVIAHGGMRLNCLVNITNETD